MYQAKSIILAAAVAAIFALPAGAQNAQYTKVGTLDCDISAGIGMIIASQKGVQCMFTPSAGRRPEVYVGTITKYGIDVGATAGGRMLWAVYAPSSAPPQRALAGNYAGATAEATVGAGAGANALVGGNDRTITLQPLSVQGQTGLNLAVGVAGLSLNSAR